MKFAPETCSGQLSLRVHQLSQFVLKLCENPFQGFSSKIAISAKSPRALIIVGG